MIVHRFADARSLMLVQSSQNQEGMGERGLKWILAGGIISTSKPRLNTEGVMRLYLPQPSRYRHEQWTSRHSTTTGLNFPLLECQPDIFCSQKWRKGASLPGPETPSDYHTKDGCIRKVTGVVNASRRCWHLDVFERKMAIKAKA